jgi:hypothetical protein
MVGWCLSSGKSIQMVSWFLSPVNSSQMVSWFSLVYRIQMVSWCLHYVQHTNGQLVFVIRLQNSNGQLVFALRTAFKWPVGVCHQVTELKWPVGVCHQLTAFKSKSSFVTKVNSNLKEGIKSIWILLLEVEDNGNIKCQPKLHLRDNLERQVWDSCATGRNTLQRLFLIGTIVKNSSMWPCMVQCGGGIVVEGSSLKLD